MAKKEIWYRQCQYQRQGEGTTIHLDTAWLPENLAKEGKTFFFKADPDETLWTVTSAGTTRREGSHLKEKERLSRTYRARTDI